MWTARQLRCTLGCSRHCDNRVTERAGLHCQGEGQVRNGVWGM